MGNIYNFLFVALLAGALVFGRSGKSDQRVEVKKVNSDHYWIKDQSENNNDKKLERKRSHKRRRKMRKPHKGLR
tara:strand:+ start:702 stop:923 length:222 start_codon:yes stop_codon:yes gene_type:complete